MTAQPLAEPVSRPAQSEDPQRFGTLEVSVISTAHAVHDTYQAFLSPLLPDLIRNLLLTKTEAGLLAVFLQLPSIFQPVMGYISDRANLRYPVILAPAITATAMSLIGIAPNYLTITLLLLVCGFSSAALHAVGPVLTGRSSGAKLGLGMSFWMVGGELGRTLGPIVVVAGVTWLTFPGLPWLMIGGWLVTLALFLRFRKTPVNLRTQPVDAEPWLPVVKKMIPVLIPVVAIQLTRSFSVGGFSTYLPTFLTEEGANRWLAGISLSVMQAAGVVGAMISGPISDRLGRKTILSITIIASTIATFLFLLGGGFQFLALIGLGFANLAMAPVLMAVVQESFPNNRALGNGIYMLFGFVLLSLGTLAVGWIGDVWGLYTAFQVCAITILAGLPFVALLPNKEKAA